MEAFVISDIHGCLKEFKELIKDIDRIKTRIILVGDLIDRGPNSEQVIDFVRDNNIECVRGNHEDMAIECLPYLLDSKNMWALGSSNWYLNGGHDVIAQYSSIPKLITDIKWLETLPLFIKTNIKNKDNLELLVSHTWISQYQNIEKASKSFDFIWNREQPKQEDVETDYYNIFGHTPVDYLKQSIYHIGPEINPKPIFYKTACNIDTGCTYNRRGRRHLTGIFFPSLEVKQIKKEFN